MLFFTPFCLFAEIKVIVFEYDNALAIEDPPLFAKNLSKIFPLEASLLEKAIKRAKEVKQEGGSEITFWENYAENYNIPLQEGWSKAYCQFKIDSLVLNEEILAKLKLFREKGIKCVLLSNMGALKKKTLSQKGHFDIFDLAIFSHEEGFPKLTPRIFEILIEQVEAMPNECLYIDSKIDSIAMAKKIGMHSLAFSPDNKSFLEELSKIVTSSN